MKKFLLLFILGLRFLSVQAQDNYIDIIIINDTPVCEKGGTLVEIYDDVDGDDNPFANPSVDFYLDSVTFCPGMSLKEIIDNVNKLKQYVDLDIFDENGTTITETYDFPGKIERDGVCNATVMMDNHKILSTNIVKKQKQ